jgi:hypothetical protein
MVFEWIKQCYVTRDWVTGDRVTGDRDVRYRGVTGDQYSYKKPTIWQNINLFFDLFC